MNKKSRTILFFGNERLATGVSTTTPVLQALLDNGYTVAAIIVAQSDGSASRQERGLEIGTIASEHGIPLLSFSKLSDAKDQLAAYDAIAGVLVAYGKMVPSSIIELFPAGIINLHPSLLPKHRGPTPLESTIINGDSVTGVSLMQLASKMDAGPIYVQQSVRLNGNEAKQALADQLGHLGKDMLVAHLPAILSGELQPSPQDDNEATYDNLITKTSGNFDEDAWNQSASDLERKIRAYAGWPRSRTKIGNTDIIITNCHIGSGKATPGTIWLDDKQLGVHTANGVIIIDTLIPLGKREMSAQAFLAGYKLDN
jgi:methionyl-tRNA formyltransferase